MNLWVKRNTDKPHRCPTCHAVATWDKPVYGPRTRLVCPNYCGVCWRVGNRRTRQLDVWWRRRERAVPTAPQKSRARTRHRRT